jgi:hypothetical protein
MNHGGLTSDRTQASTIARAIGRVVAFELS